MHLRSFTALFLLTTVNGWTKPVFVQAAASRGGADAELQALAAGQLPVGMLQRASLATARDLPPGQTATPFAALNAGTDPVSSECLCLRKGNPAINGRGSLGLSQRPEVGDVGAPVLAAARTAGLATSEAIVLERDQASSARELRHALPARLTLDEVREEPLVAAWQREGTDRNQSAMRNGASRTSAMGGASAGGGAVGSQPMRADAAESSGAGAATLEAALDQPAEGQLALGEWKPGTTPDSGIVGIGTSAEPTLIARAVQAYLPGAAPVSRETEALSQRVALLQKSYAAASVTASDVAPARAPAVEGSAAASNNHWESYGAAAGGATGDTAYSSNASAIAQIAAALTDVSPAGTAVANVPAAPEEAVAALAGVALTMTPAAAPPSSPAALLAAASVADPLTAAMNNPEPGTLMLISIGALLVLVSQIGNRKKSL